jgi:hypothetical protein
MSIPNDHDDVTFLLQVSPGSPSADILFPFWDVIVGSQGQVFVCIYPGFALPLLLFPLSFFPSFPLSLFPSFPLSLLPSQSLAFSMSCILPFLISFFFIKEKDDNKLVQLFHANVGKPLNLHVYSLKNDRTRGNNSLSSFILSSFPPFILFPPIV